MSETLKPADVLVESTGDVPAGAVAEARERIAALSRFTGRPILHARITIEHAPGRSADARTTARAVLDVNGDSLHAHASAETAHQAITGVQDRLKARLERLGRRDTRHRTVEPGGEPLPEHPRAAVAELDSDDLPAR